MRPLLVLPLLLALAAFTAGCGAQRGKPYTAKGTIPCLRDHGFHAVTTKPAKVGLIASIARYGGLQATTSDDNVLTIAFTESAAAVKGTKQAFRRAAPPQLRSRMDDITNTKGNAVLIWTVTPQKQQLDDALACLRP